MQMKEKHIKAFMKSAQAFAECSSGVRLQVGAIVVKDDRIISIGYNGTPAGWDNVCEDKVYFNGDPTVMIHEELSADFPYRDHQGLYYRLVTKPEVLHAEFNAIAKLAKSHESGDGATLFCTTAPCYECAKLIHASGIKAVYYETIYRLDDGLRFLAKAGVEVTQISVK